MTARRRFGLLLRSSDAAGHALTGKQPDQRPVMTIGARGSEQKIHGISVLPGRRVILSWGIPSSLTAGQIWAAPVRHA